MNLKQKFYNITNLIQQEFDRNAEKYGSKIQCRKGCSQCCSQIFRITLLDAYIIQEHIKSLPLERQIELKTKAEEYMKRLPLESKAPLKKHVQYSDTGGNLGGFEHRQRVNINRHPCPALGSEGECTIYEARPVICRRFGPPIYDYKNPGNVYACELNFSPGEEIIDDKLIPNQTDIGIKWDDLKEEYLAHLPLNKGEWSETEGVETLSKGDLGGFNNKKSEHVVNFTTIAEAVAAIEV